MSSPQLPADKSKVYEIESEEEFEAIGRKFIYLRGRYQDKDDTLCEYILDASRAEILEHLICPGSNVIVAAGFRVKFRTDKGFVGKETLFNTYMGMLQVAKREKHKHIGG